MMNIRPAWRKMEKFLKKINVEITEYPVIVKFFLNISIYFSKLFPYNLLLRIFTVSCGDSSSLKGNDNFEFTRLPLSKRMGMLTNSNH